MLFISGVIYIWLNDTSLQPWNNPKTVDEDPKELMPLHKKEEGEIVKIHKSDKEISGRD